MKSLINTSLVILLMALLLALGVGCGEKICEDCPGEDIIEGPYNPTPVTLNVPEHLPDPIIPADNPLTKEGIELGRRLFYDNILSSDGSFSCASCHDQKKAFTDGRATSSGVLGISGRRNAMSLVNLAFNPNGFFWDGRDASLEIQALEPVEDHIELNESWPTVEEKLRQDSDYPARFRAAFGIDHREEITRDLAVKAIAQFERTLVSGNSRYDQVRWYNEGWFTDQEERGRELFFIEFAISIDHPGCSHCHFDPLFTDNLFKNNGLDNVSNLQDFADRGRGEANGNIRDNGKFRVPTLRNIALTAPYMHDGRFATLEEVIAHYQSGGHGVENEDPNIRPFQLSAEDQAALIAFLHTLTDTSFTNNPAFSNPFR